VEIKVEHEDDEQKSPEENRRNFYRALYAAWEREHPKDLAIMLIIDEAYQRGYTDGACAVAYAQEHNDETAFPYTDPPKPKSK
jgi:hypothetical protein